MRFLLVTEGARIVASGLARRVLGHRRYEGDAAQICEQIIATLFDPHRRFYRTSLTTYPEFWARDFGRAAPALLALGRESEVGDTFRYALARYEREGRFALVITPRNHLFDFPVPCYAPDGFAFFLRGLAALRDDGLVRRHRGFLERESRRFHETVVDPATGLVRRGVHFSEAQDYAVRDSSCYSNVMCYVVQRALDSLGLPNPLARYDYRRLIVEGYLFDDLFLDDARRSDHVSGDAAILPFWSGLLGHGDAARTLFERVLVRMDAAGLNRPYPSRYGASRARRGDALRIERLNPWQRDAVWPCLGLQLVEALCDYGMRRSAVELDALRRLVERHRCFPEVVDTRTEGLYRSAVYTAEDSMIWAANLLALLRRSARAHDFTPISPSGPRGVSSPRYGSA